MENSAGPGAIIERGESPKPLLEDATENDVVTLLNPLSVTFIGRVGVTRPATVPFAKEEEIQRNYGIAMRNQDHTGRVHIQNNVEIKAGQTINLLGSEAKVIIRQIVREVLQRNGKKLLLADPFAQREVEEQIVMGRRSVTSLMGTEPVSIQEQARNAVQESNEKEFPGLTGDAGQGDSGETERTPTPQRRSPGRPKKPVTD